MTKKLPDNFDQVRTIFSAYLEKNQLRRTPERYHILEEIYSRTDHFEADMLFIEMKNNDFNVSRATVYNTLELLLECGLVKKHQFGQNTSHFEQSYGFKQHDHLICVKCNKVLEFCDPRMQQITATMGKLLKFEISSHSLHLFGEPLTNSEGICNQCGQNTSKLANQIHHG